MNDPTHSNDSQVPPFWGAQKWAPPLDEVSALVNRMSLLVGRWGFKRGQGTEAEFRSLLDGEAQGHFERLLRENARRNLFVPRAAVAWVVCSSEDAAPAHIPDCFPPLGAPLGCFVVTVGSPSATAELARMHAQGEFQEYFFWTGFAAELADATAEWTHRKMCALLGGEPLARVAPGFPVCPDLEFNRKFVQWTQACEIGVSVTESGMLDPEMSTCAVLVTKEN